jgi:hypothetical protein
VTVQATVPAIENVHELSVFGGPVDVFDTDSDNNDDSLLFRTVSATPPPAPTPTPSPAPTPPPDPPAAPPSPAPAASGGGGGGGGGGGVDLMMFLLLLGAAAHRSFRSGLARRYEVHAAASNQAALVQDRDDFDDRARGQCL